MKIPKECKIEKMAHPKNWAFRDILKHVHIERDKDGHGLAVATDGMMLACVPVEFEPEDTAGLVSVEALTQARRLAKGGDSHSQIAANGCLKLANGVTLPRPATDEKGEPLPDYPNWRQVVPNGSVPPKFVVALNAARLHAVSEAIGCDEFSRTAGRSRKSLRCPVRVGSSSPGTRIRVSKRFR